jgi:hypothetical protein
VAFTSESGTHKSEEQSEGKQMEVDFLATLKLQPSKLEITFGTIIMSSATKKFGKVEGFVPIQASALKATAHSDGVVDPMFSTTTTKDERAPLVVGSSMEGVTFISIQLETIAVPATTTPNSFVAIEDLRIYVRIEITKVTIMEN